MHVDAEDQLLAGHELQAGDQVAVAGAGDDPLVLPHRERVGAGRADGQPARRRRGLHLAPQALELAAGLLGVLTGDRGDLAHRLHQLGLDLALGLAGCEILEQALDGVDEIEGLRVHDHQLLLDPEGVARAREPVLHGASLSVRTVVQTTVSWLSQASDQEAMTPMTLGYDGKLYILAFDHRGSFQKKMFGIEGDADPGADRDHRGRQAPDLRGNGQGHRARRGQRRHGHPGRRAVRRRASPPRPRSGA